MKQKRKDHKLDSFKPISLVNDDHSLSSHQSSLTLVEMALFNYIDALNGVILAMRKFDKKTLEDKECEMKWKYAANTFNKLFFYCSILYSFIIYVIFLIDAISILNKPYVIIE